MGEGKGLLILCLLNRILQDENVLQTEMLGCCFKKQFLIYFYFLHFISIIKTKQRQHPVVNVTGDRSQVDAVKSNFA